MAAPTGIAVALAANTLDAVPTWTRLDTTYNVQSWKVDRGRVGELDKTGAGTAEIRIVDKTGAFDLTDGPLVTVQMQAAICLQNPVTSTWHTLFRGFVDDVEWVPYVNETFANVTLKLVDLMGLLSAAEMTADGSYGSVGTAFAGQVNAGGNIVFDEDLLTTAVQTRINGVLTQFGLAANVAASDGVTNGTTTFTSASAAFATTDEGKFIKIFGKGVYQIVTRNSATNITLSGSPSAGSSLAYSYGMRSTFTGNVKLQETVYAARSSVLSVIMDCCDAEFPSSANYFIDRNGRSTFRGRARFDPTNVDYEITTWLCGDDTYVNAAPSTRVRISPPLVPYQSSADIYTVGIAIPKEPPGAPFTDTDLAGQVYEDTLAIAAYGTRTWSAENLITAGGSGTTALQETKLFAQAVVDNNAVPQTRVGTLTIRPQRATGTYGAATWLMLSTVDISDRIYLETTWVGGGGFADYFYVEGIHYEAKPMNGAQHEVTLTLDVSPATFYSSNPF